MDEKILDLHVQHSSIYNRQQPESSVDTEFSSSSNFHGSKLDFPRFNGDDRLDGYIGKKNISVCITLLMSTKSHLHNFICNVNPLNGSVGTSRIMKSSNGQIFANSFCTDLALVVLMNSQEHSPNFTRLAL